MSIKELARNICPPVLWKFVSASSAKLLNKPGIDPRYNKFHGVYEKFKEIEDQNPWVSPEWLNLSAQKLNSTYQNNENVPEIYGPYALLGLLINGMPKIEINVLDWGGGTGLLYWCLKPIILKTKTVFWHVVDNEKLKELSDSILGKTKYLNFTNVLPEKKSFDIIAINTSLQYVEDQESLLKKIMSYKAQYIVFTRLLAHKTKSYTTCQNIYGYNTPCKFSNLERVLAIANEEGYKPTLMFGGGQNLRDLFHEDVPLDYRVPYDCNIVFERI